MKQKKIIVLIITVFLGTCVYSQNAIIEKDSTFTRYIFPKDHFIFLNVPNQKAQYTPSIEDIKEAENILNSNLRYLEKEQMKQNGLAPYIYRCLKCYDRQYLGFITKDEEIILFINFIWTNKQPMSELSKDIISVLGGGSYYWSVFVNITKGKLFKMRINGIS